MNRIVPLTLLATLCMPLGGCNRDAAIQQRAEDIKRFNEKNDALFSAKAIDMVRKRWLIEGKMWYGRMPDGAVARLESPIIEVLPIRKGKPFYSGWAGDVILTCTQWTSRPASRPRAFIQIKYRATFEDQKNGELEIAEGPRIKAASATDVLIFHAAEQPDAAPAAPAAQTGAR